MTIESRGAWLAEQKPKQQIMTSHMISRNELVDDLRDMISSGFTIDVVTNISSFQDPNKNGDDVAIWLVIYTPGENQ